MPRSTPRRTLPLVLGAMLIPIGFLVPREPAPPATPRPVAPATLGVEDWPMEAAAARGRKIYEENCIGCHGEEGLGDGPAAAWLDPVPRNFQKGYFKFRTSASGQLPFGDDVFRTITRGLPGSSMPAFNLVPEPERRDVVAYVLHLATFGRAKVLADYMIKEDGLTLEQVRKNHLAEIRMNVQTSALDARKPVSIPPQPTATAEVIDHGRQIYARQCAACHGPTGRGDGPSSYTLRDWQDAESHPRDFTSGTFRSGNTARDLYTRMRTGLNGTPMPSASSEPDQDIWALVAFIQSLKTPGVVPTTRRMVAEDGK